MKKKQSIEAYLKSCNARQTLATLTLLIMRDIQANPEEYEPQTGKIDDMHELIVLLSFLVEVQISEISNQK